MLIFETRTKQNVFINFGLLCDNELFTSTYEYRHDRNYEIRESQALTRNSFRTVANAEFSRIYERAH